MLSLVFLFLNLLYSVSAFYLQYSTCVASLQRKPDKYWSPYSINFDPVYQYSPIKTFEVIKHLCGTNSTVYWVYQREGNVSVLPATFVPQEQTLKPYLVFVKTSYPDGCFSQYSLHLNLKNYLREGHHECTGGGESEFLVSRNCSITNAKDVCLVNKLWKFVVHVRLKNGKTLFPQAVVIYIAHNSLTNEMYDIGLTPEEKEQVQHLRYFLLTRWNTNHRARRSLELSFSRQTYTANVAEEKPRGLVVGTYFPSNPGKASIVLSLRVRSDSRSAQMFTINPNSGLVTTTAQLDRETMPAHYFDVIATDTSNAFNVATATLNIIVMDANDHAPVFEKQKYERNVSENLELDSHILYVVATDKDEGRNSEITYTISNPDENQPFTINQHSGEIKNVRTLDRETKARYTLRIIGSDQGPHNERKISTCEVVVNVKDENDNVPLFDRKEYNASVEENVDVTNLGPIVRVQAFDKDTGDNARISYSITHGNDDGLFTIDASSGTVRLTKVPDYERKREYHLRIRARDHGKPFKQNSTTLLVSIIDKNDNAPSFSSALFETTVLENVPLGHEVLEIQAHDPDSGGNGRLTYRISSTGSNSLPFVLDAESGKLRTSESLDREKKSFYRFTVIAQDHGSPPKTGQASVSVTLADVNDETPKFEKNIYSVRLSENHEVKSHVITLSAIDRDSNAMIKYSIVRGNDAGMFSIVTSANKATLKLARRLDYKKQHQYILTIEASDQVSSSQAQLFINITDANNAAPVFKNLPSKISVREDVAAGSQVFEVQATDDDAGDNARISYSLSEHQGSFAIDRESGVITVAKTLDREFSPSYAVSVHAKDNGVDPKLSMEVLEIEVTDVNDNRPKFTKASYSASVNESSMVNTVVTTVSATDADIGKNARIRYTFVGGNSGNGDFKIDHNGKIRIANRLDRERVSTYKLKVIAKDYGTPSLSSSTQVLIHVIDINDNAPQFDVNPVELYVKENTPVGTEIGRIAAKDADVSPNNVILYEISGGVDAGSFQLDTVRGVAVIRSKIPLDYEGHKKLFLFNVKASSAHLFSEISVIVRLIDVNDHLPQFKNFKIIVNNFDQHFPTGNIGRIPAFDQDVGDTLTYKIVHGNDASLLKLDGKTGLLQLNARLNSDMPFNASFTVTVFDGRNHASARCQLIVRLVTNAMLMNSVTVRLRNVSDILFLSKLYSSFIEGIVTLLPLKVRQDDVFIFNVQNDTDVIETVLNVSFAVKRLTSASIEDNFYSSRELRELIYLKRHQLTRSTGVEVMPFDDNLCLHEPCRNAEDCESMLKFANVSEFLSSDTTLFRPIRTFSWHHCVCPRGYTGISQANDCNFQVNMCHSNPCGGNGTCLAKENGFTCECHPGFVGDLCEHDMRRRKYERYQCPSNICRPPSTCETLLQSGFRCAGCSQVEYHDDLCRLKMRRFTPGSFLLFPSLKVRSNFTIRMTFATRQSDGLLLFNGRFNGQHDFVALEIVKHRLQFSYSLGGAKVSKALLHSNIDVTSGKWVNATVSYNERKVVLSVSEEQQSCNVKVASKVRDDSSCATDTYYPLPTKCEDPNTQCYRYLDLTGPLHIGGLSDSENTSLVSSKRFDGCIGNIFIDGVLVDMNEFAWNSGTNPGCQPKRSHCNSLPCKNGGSCLSRWNSFLCDCPSGYVGQSCETLAVGRKTFSLSNGYLLYNSKQPNVQSPWYNSLEFRTRQNHGTLLRIQLNGRTVHYVLEKGYPTLQYEGLKYRLLDTNVSDGEWHSLQVAWKRNVVSVDLDHGSINKDHSVKGYLIGRSVVTIYVGGYESRSSAVGTVRGCFRNVRVGNAKKAILPAPTVSTRAYEGCRSTNYCTNNPCPMNSGCIPKWNSYTCKCREGFSGPSCLPVCQKYNPCAEGSTCIQQNDGYRCECLNGYFGKHCTNTFETTCPSTWWGIGVCGPCNCAEKDGFSTECNRTTGECFCKSGFYLPLGSSKCIPCKCYENASYGRSCDMFTGQCRCHSNVLGRSCDSCPSLKGELTENCYVTLDSCPTALTKGIEWMKTEFGFTSIQPCPGNSYGNAKRFCSSDGWGDVDIGNCSSKGLAKIERQARHLDENKLIINNFTANSLIKHLAAALGSLENLFPLDVRTSVDVMQKVFIYEKAQKGLGLTHTQNRNFLHNVIFIMDTLFDPKFRESWPSNETADQLLSHVEQYTKNLVDNMPSLSNSSLFYPTTSCAFALDVITPSDFSVTDLPRIPHNQSGVLFRLYQKDPTKVPDDDAKLFVGYSIYTYAGSLFAKRANSTLLKKGKGFVVNSPILVLDAHGSKLDDKATLRSIEIVAQFKIVYQNLRSNPRCVYWDKNVGWNGEGCTLQETVTDFEDVFVYCRCSHLSIFAVITDEMGIQNVSSNAITISPGVYVLVTLAILCLIAALVVFCCMRTGSNMTTIYINKVLNVLIAELIFIIGIERIEIVQMCRMVAILLHYFWITCFGWLCIEVLHIYRMLTERRSVNEGSMRVYYFIAYIVPICVVGISVGLHIQQYGNDRFCWISSEETVFWGLIIPVLIAIGINIVVFVLAVVTAYRVKTEETDLVTLKFGLAASLASLPLCIMILLFAVFATNFDIIAFQYLFAIACVFQAVVILLIQIVFNKRTHAELKRAWSRRKESSSDDLANTKTTIVSRLGSVLDGDLKGASTSSGSGHHGSQRNGPQRNGPQRNGRIIVGLNNGDSSLFYDQEGNLADDSDSDISQGPRDKNLASSHSSDDEDSEYSARKAGRKPKHKLLDRIRITKHSTPITERSRSQDIVPLRNLKGSPVQHRSQSDRELNNPGGHERNAFRHGAFSETDEPSPIYPLNSRGLRNPSPANSSLNGSVRDEVSFTALKDNRVGSLPTTPVQHTTPSFDNTRVYSLPSTPIRPPTWRGSPVDGGKSNPTYESFNKIQSIKNRSAVSPHRVSPNPGYTSYTNGFQSPHLITPIKEVNEDQRLSLYMDDDNAQPDILDNQDAPDFQHQLPPDVLPKTSSIFLHNSPQRASPAAHYHHAPPANHQAITNRPLNSSGSSRARSSGQSSPQENRSLSPHYVTAEENLQQSTGRSSPRRRSPLSPTGSRFSTHEDERETQV